MGTLYIMFWGQRRKYGDEDIGESGGATICAGWHCATPKYRVILVVDQTNIPKYPT